MSYPSNTDSVAADQIRAFVERIMRLREEAKAINGDIREVYAEAKGNGFDKTILGKLVSYVEKRAAGAADLQEAEALFDLYLSAYDGAVGTVRATRSHTHEADIPHDAETGEIIEPTPVAQIAAGLTEALAVVKGEAEPHRVHQIPGNAGARVEAHEVAAAGESPALLSQGANTGGENVAPPPAHASEQPGTDHGSVDPPAEGDANSAAIANPAVPLTQERGATGGESAVIPSAALVVPNVVSIRTHNPDTHFLNANGLPRLHGCQNPDACAGSWRALCRGCGTPAEQGAVQ